MRDAADSEDASHSLLWELIKSSFVVSCNSASQDVFYAAQVINGTVSTKTTIKVYFSKGRRHVSIMMEVHVCPTGAGSARQSDWSRKCTSPSAKLDKRVSVIHNLHAGERAKAFSNAAVSMMC